MPPLSLMLKPASARCNLRCAYCFYHDVADTRSQKDRGIMPVALAEEIIQKALAYTDGEPLRLVFQGGEPLIAGYGFFETVFRFLSEYNKKYSRIFVSVQTNGTLLTPAFCRLFTLHDVLVGLSLDGGLDANALRIDANGNPSFPAVSDALTMLKDAQTNFNILTVLTQQNGFDIKNTLAFFEGQGVSHVQLIDCLNPFDALEAGHALSNADYLAAENDAFDFYATRFFSNRPMRIRRFDNLINLINGHSAEECGMNGHCSHQIVVEGDGTLYPCDFYCTDPHTLGNIRETDFHALLKNTTALRFITESLPVRSECKACSYYQLCKGGCKRYTLSENRCAATKAFFQRNIKTLERLARG